MNSPRERTKRAFLVMARAFFADRIPCLQILKGTLSDDEAKYFRNNDHQKHSAFHLRDIYQNYCYK